MRSTSRWTWKQRLLSRKRRERALATTMTTIAMINQVLQSLAPALYTTLHRSAHQHQLTSGMSSITDYSDTETEDSTSDAGAASAMIPASPRLELAPRPAFERRRESVKFFQAQGYFFFSDASPRGKRPHLYALPSQDGGPIHKRGRWKSMLAEHLTG